MPGSDDITRISEVPIGDVVLLERQQMEPTYWDTFLGEHLLQRKTLLNQATNGPFPRHNIRSLLPEAGFLFMANDSRALVFYDKVHAAVLLHASVAVLYA